MRAKHLLTVLIWILALAFCQEGFGRTIDGKTEQASNAAKGAVFLPVSRQLGGASPADEPGEALQERFESLKESFKDLTEELRRIPESEEFKKFQKKVDRFGEDLKRSGEAFREKMNRDVLPRLEKEMERLREWLDELEGKETPRPLKI